MDEVFQARVKKRRCPSWQAGSLGHQRQLLSDITDSSPNSPPFSPLEYYSTFGKISVGSVRSHRSHGSHGCIMGLPVQQLGILGLISCIHGFLRYFKSLSIMGSVVRKANHFFLIRDSKSGERGHSGLVGGGLGILGSNFFIVFFAS